MKIVPITAEHLKALEPRSLPYTVRGIAVLDGEKVMGIAGIFPDQGRLVLFSEFSKDARALLGERKQCRVLIRACRQILTLAKQWKMPIHAVPDMSVYGSVNLLNHLGFKPLYKNTYELRQEA